MNIDIMAKTTVHKSSWIADGFDVLFSVIYLLEKHSNLCVPYYKVSKESILNDVIIFWNHNSVSKKANPKDYFFEYPGNKERFLKSMSLCLKNKSRFIIVPIGIKFSSGSGGHFNVILIDKENKTIERFEPYGVETLHDLSIMTMFEKKFKGIFNQLAPGYKLYSGNKLCPESGIQMLEEEAIQKGEGTAIELESDPIGYCIAWSIYYVDMRLTYLKVKPQKLVKLILTNLQNYKHSLRTFIRNYSAFLLKEKTKFLKSLDVYLNRSLTSGNQKNFSKNIEKKLTNYFMKKLIEKK